MDLNTALDFIIKDLHEAGEIIDDLKKYPGVPEFQVELAKSKCNSASEVIAFLKKLPVQTASPAEEKPQAKRELPKDKPSDSSVGTMAPSEDQITIPIGKKEEEKPSSTKKETPSPAGKPSESAIIADQFANRPESYVEKLSSLKHEEDVLEVLKARPLSSLNEAIGINDKFLFIREIFNGNQESYELAINKLETVGNLSDAMALVMSYTGDNTSSDAVKQLLDLIKRKFPTNE